MEYVSDSSSKILATHTLRHQAILYIVRRDGNEAAHAGDAITDAYVYTSGRRMDIDLFTSLYGVSHEIVVDLGKRPSYCPVLP